MQVLRIVMGKIGIDKAIPLNFGRFCRASAEITGFVKIHLDRDFTENLKFELYKINEKRHFIAVFSETIINRH